MTEPPLPIDLGLRDVVRGPNAAPAGARARVRARLEASLPGLLADPGLHAPAPAGVPAPVSPLITAVVAFVAGGVTGAALLGVLHRPTTRVVYVDRPVPAAPATAPVEAPAPAAAEAPAPANTSTDDLPQTAAPKAAMASRRTSGSAATNDAPSRGAHASAFAAERALLDAARAEIVQGAPERAISSLEQHRARYPDGMLAEERDAMLVEALVGAGRYAEARRQAEAFRARSPSSLFTATVDSAIESIP